MIHNVVIRMLPPLMHKTALSCVYSIGNELRILGTDGRVFRGEMGKFLSQSAVHPYETPFHRPKPFDVNGTLEYRFSYTTKINDNGNEEGVTSTDKDKKEEAEIFWANHPNVTVNKRHHANVTNPMFNMTDSALQTVEGLQNFDDMLRVSNVINAMTIARMREVMYYYGKSPKGKTAGELKLILCNVDPSVPPENIDGLGYMGICLRKENMEKFLKVWTKDENNERDMRVVLAKAIELNVVQKQTGKTGFDTYYLGQTPIGNSIDDMMIYFIKEESMYNEFVLRSVNDKDNFKSEEKASKVLEDAKHTGKIGEMNDMEIKQLRDEAKQLKKEGYLPITFQHHMAKAKQLLEKVEAAREEKRKKESHLEKMKKEEATLA